MSNSNNLSLSIIGSAKFSILSNRAGAPPLVSGNARIVEIDGLRGFAAILVVLSHYFGEVDGGLKVFTFGWVGVDLFFALSGFLIGSIILERKDSPNFARVFYLRRGLRIVPIYVLTVATVLVFLKISPPAHWIDLPLPALSYFTFTQNIMMAAKDAPGSLWLLPTWTLAVEEQFYLLIPLVLLALPSRYVLPILFFGVLIGLGVRGLFQWSYPEALAKHVLLPTRWDPLLSGVIAAYIYRYFECNQDTVRLIPALAVSILLLAAIFSSLTGLDLFYLVRPLSMAALLVPYILLAAQGSEILRPFRSVGWRFFGTISYGLYLIHQPVSGIMHGLLLGSRPDMSTFPQLLVTLGALIVSVALAWISWTFLEAPLVRMGRRWQYK